VRPMFQDSNARQGRRKAELPDWRNFLTPSERLDLEALEKNAQNLAKKRERITGQITRHRNRCTKRREEHLRLEELKAARAKAA